ncbi:DUF2628 domain-containing protein [Microvirga sp. 2MCAF35]|uniref:DUF2628 domain-containing protein n=1 Tax=Microvirga sp. 2MCAF35 TaxID=3232987 RepID=UPI003F9462AA
MIATDATSAVKTFEIAAQSRNDDLFVAFVGPNHETYSRVLAKMRAKDPSLRKVPLTWCWPAFLITVPWLLYRKLYGWAAGLIGAVAIFSLVLPTNSTGGTLAVHALLGMIGKGLYVQRALQRIEKLRSRASSEEELEALVKKAGGVSIPGAVIGTILFIGFNVLAFVDSFAKHG